MKDKENKISKLLQRKLLGVDWQRIESWISRGVPDLNGCISGIEFWIEIKIATKTGKIKIRPEQVAWLTRRTQHGGRAYVLTKLDEMLYLHDGSLARDLVDNGILKVPPMWVGHMSKSLDVLLRTLIEGPETVFDLDAIWAATDKA